MHLTAWLIGEDAENTLNDLTAPDGYPPAEVWVPLEASFATPSRQLLKYRSAWAYRTACGEQWVDFAMAADTILDAVGPRALANPRSLTHGTALRSNVQERDGVLMVKVPRYFSTVATQWTVEQVGQDPLITQRGRETTWTTVGQLDLKATLGDRERVPGLVIDQNGPRLLRRKQNKYYNVSGMKDAQTIKTAIRKMPPDTPILCAWCAD